MTPFKKTQETIQNAAEVAKDGMNVALMVSAAAIIIATIALVVAVSRN